MGRLLLVGVVLALGSCREKSAEQPRPKAPVQRPPSPSVRMTMAELHASGGVPPGWMLTIAPGDVEAGRRIFADVGCGSCHAVKGEPFEPTGIGPDLSGMGSHHPAAYFVESILNPDAVIVDGPGYSGPDGRSIMPSYPDLTIAQLTDVVAYVKSLGGGEMPTRPTALPALAPRPAAPPQAASVFFVQAYDVQPGKLAEFEAWFRREGAARFLAYPGLLSIETYVDGTRDRQAVLTIWGFRDQESLSRFQSDPHTDGLGNEFDGFIGPHEHLVFTSPVVYKAPTLSAP
jgi:mono/diheme cytochrome c family protein/heme-degrading monooxygenase HmoA